jgi:hypothetical protein
MQLDPAERELLRTLWEANGLAAVLRALADVAGDNGRLVRAISQDEVTAESWERTATYLDKVADTKTVRSCPFP